MLIHDSRIGPVHNRVLPAEHVLDCADWGRPLGARGDFSFVLRLIYFILVWTHV